MKKKLFLALTLCLAMALCMLLSSCFFFSRSNQSTEELSFAPADNGGWMVTGMGNYSSSDVVIPQTYQDGPVTEIDENAFICNKTITSVIIPDSVEKIGTYAFGDCPKLQRAEIGSGVKEIGSNIFNNCEALNTVTLKEGMTVLGEHMFSGCSSLKELTIPSTVEIIPRIGGDIEKLTISEGVKEIGDYAFDMNTTLEAIVLPNSIEKIGEGAFSTCKNLKSVTFGSGLKTIERAAFFRCESLKSIQLNEGLETIGEMAFEDCKLLVSVVIPSTVTQIDGGFGMCRRIVEVYNLSALDVNECCYFSSDTVIHTSLDEESVVFETEDGLVFFKNGEEYLLVAYTSDKPEVVLPEYFNEKRYNIRRYAFSDLMHITRVDVPDTVTQIGDYAFYFCENLMRFTIPKYVKRIGDSCFWNCYRLVEIYNLASYDLSEITRHFYGDGNVLVEHKSREDESALTITQNGYAFIEYDDKCALVAYVGNDTNLSLPERFNDKTYRINDYAFINKSGIESMVIPNTVTELGIKSFFRSSILDLTLPDTITSIDKDIFEESYNIIETENGISYIDRWVIGCEESITEAALRDNTVGISASSFKNCSSLSSIKFPSTLKVIGKRAFEMCTSLTDIYIPKTVRYIDDVAFFRCDNAVIYFESEEDNLESATVWNFESRPVVWGAIEYGRTEDGFVWGKNASNEIIIADYLGSNTELVIPSEINGSRVTKIADYAFYENEVLTSVTIPSSITYIGMGAFKRAACISQDENGVCYVDKWVVDCDFDATYAKLRNDTVGIVTLAFDYCDKLTAVIIPNSVQYVENVAFTVCEKLTIYCEATALTELWHSNWNPDGNEVVLGYTGEEIIE